MTTRDYISEILLRLPRFKVAYTISEPELMTYINEARRDVQKYVLGIMPERFSKIVDLDLVEIASGQPMYFYALLPDDFVECYVAKLKWIDSITGIPYESEARRVNKREASRVQSHSWDAPTLARPIYIPEKIRGATWLLYMDCGETALTDIGTDVQAEVWYTFALPDLEDILDIPGGEDSPDIESIPRSLEELVILYAMHYCLGKMDEKRSRDENLEDLNLAKQTVGQEYAEKRMKQEILLPTKEDVRSA